MQASLTMWHGLLQATGGDLVPDKCFWYLLNFQWANNHWRYKTIEETPGQLTVQTEEQTMIIIPRLEALEARQTLGVRLVPDRNDKEEARYLQSITMEWKTKMQKARLSREAAEFSLQQVLLPNLRYPLIATNFSEKQCYEILKPTLNQALPAMGFNEQLPMDW